MNPTIELTAEQAKYIKGGGGMYGFAIWRKLKTRAQREADEKGEACHLVRRGKILQTVPPEEPMNSRVLCFLAAHQLTVKDIERVDGELPRLKLGEDTLPWTLHYRFWNTKQLIEWAASVGYPDNKSAIEPSYRDALLYVGHDAFDAWLTAKYPPVAEP